VPTTEEKAPNVDLTPREKREVERRAPPRAAVVFETIRREALGELERPVISLLASGLGRRACDGLLAADSGGASQRISPTRRGSR
jgi:hypothetical protein